MSLRAMSWALYEAPVTDPTQALVLVALAEHSGEDGRHAWPSQGRLAELARVTTRSVRRILADLEDRKLIRRGDQRLVDHLPADRRPVVWDLALPDLDGRTSTTGRQRPPGRPRPVADDQTAGHGRPTNRPEPSKNKNNATTEDDGETVSFAEFWMAYPRKVAKPAAMKAWAKARKDTPAAVIVAAVQAARWPEDPKFIPHPSTWLNGRRWEDDPEPAPAPRKAGPRFASNGWEAVL